jgi:hypothetical protein
MEKRISADNGQAFTVDYDMSDWDRHPLCRPIQLDDTGNLALDRGIREQAHSKVYQVAHVPTLQPGLEGHLEAQVFLLDPETVPDKVRRHRLRCIKRRASRTVLEAKVSQFRIIVYETGDVPRETVGIRGSRDSPGGPVSSLRREKGKQVLVGEEEQGSQTLGSAPESHKSYEAEDGNDHGLDNCGVQDSMCKGIPCKASYTRESARVRQRERRQAVRRLKRQQSAATSEVNQGNGSSTLGNETIILDSSGDVDNFWMLVLLYLAYDEHGHLRDKIPDNADQALQGMNGTVLLGFMQQYIGLRTIDFDGAEEMEEYMAVKQSEIIFLRRQQKKMAKVDEHYKDQCLAVMREQQARNKQGSGSQQCKELQRGVTQFAMHRLMVVRHVTKALPEVIKKAEQTYRDLKPKLALVRQREKEKRRIEGLRGKSEALQEKLRMLASWYSSVVPLSTTYAELADRWAVVEDQLKSSEAAYKEAMLESSDAREEDLLRVKVK